MIISTTSIIPHSYRVYSSEAIVPMAVTFGSHLIWPFVLDPYFTTFTVSPSQSDDGYFRSWWSVLKRTHIESFASRLVFSFWIKLPRVLRRYVFRVPYLTSLNGASHRKFQSLRLACLPIIEALIPILWMTISVICFGSSAVCSWPLEINLVK